jgi:hypothetical protein
MLIGVARKFYPTPDMVCDTCGGNSKQVRFASSLHDICISCEQVAMKRCACCDKEKPLTQYAINVRNIGRRTPICKECKASARRLKYAIGARCCLCSVKIDGLGSGAKRYCGPCSVLPRPKPEIVIKSAFNLTDYLSKPWRLA